MGLRMFLNVAFPNIRSHIYAKTLSEDRDRSGAERAFTVGPTTAPTKVGRIGIGSLDEALPVDTRLPD